MAGDSPAPAASAVNEDGPSTSENEAAEDAKLVPSSDAADGNDHTDAAATESTSETAPVVDPEKLAELKAMGFSHNRSVRALLYGDGGSVDGAANWLIEHEGDADIDDAPPADAAAAAANAPPPPRELTAEQKAAQLQLLKDRIAENRRIQAEQEKVNEKKREKDRLKSGRELADVKRKLDEQERRRALDLRRRQKDEDAAHREQLRMKLQEDRVRRFGEAKAKELEERDREKVEALARQRAEKAELERKAQEAKAAQHSARDDGAELDVNAAIKGMRAALDRLGGNDAAVRRTCLSTLLIYLTNLVEHPDDERYRSIRVSNAGFQRRVASAAGGVDFLHAIGFLPDSSNEQLVVRHNDRIMLNRARGDLELYLEQKP